jgi:hypothetical protein
MAKRKQRVEAVEGRLLRDIEKLTSREFVYEDGWCGMVPFDGKVTELQTGPPVPFAELTWREQADVLREFIHWDRYPERAWNDEYTIRDNIAAGKRPEQWFDGTSLRQTFQLLADGKTPPAPKQWPELSEQDLADIRDALGMAGVDRPSAAPEEKKLSLRDLQHGSQEEEKRGEDQREKPREIER